MKWFDRWFEKKCRESWENPRNVKAVESGVYPSTHSGVEGESDLHFRIYSATGGHVMEFRKYDRRTDQTQTQLYVIAKEEDIGERVARIVNLEMLK
jgi:hypothetical protein